MAPRPLVGDIMSFRYPDEAYHRFYNDFPGGRRVRPFEAYVDLNGPIIVLDVRVADSDGVEIIAVQFRSHNGTLLWTTFAKDGVMKMNYVQV